MTKRIARYTPPFGESCNCGHLGFVHVDGEHACLARYCRCIASSVVDQAGKYYGSAMGNDVNRGGRPRGSRNKRKRIAA